MGERLINTRDGSVVASSVAWARTPWARARGLIGRPPLARGQALVLAAGAQVHTFFMASEIDVVFCDRDWVVLHVISVMPAWRISRWVSGTRSIIELRAGGAEAISVGDRLALEAQGSSVL